MVRTRHCLASSNISPYPLQKLRFRSPIQTVCNAYPLEKTEDLACTYVTRILFDFILYFVVRACPPPAATCGLCARVYMYVSRIASPDLSSLKAGLVAIVDASRIRDCCWCGATL